MRRSDWIAAAVAAIVTPLALLGEMPRPGVDIGTDYWRVRCLMDEGLSLPAASHFIETIAVAAGAVVSSETSISLASIS